MPSTCQPRTPTESLRSGRPCKISAEVKKRSGDPQWWCIEHGEAASGPGGLPLDECPAAAFGPVDDLDILTIDPADYPGGVGIWASLPAPLRFGTVTDRRGVHVHARRQAHGPKVFDDTFAIVRLVSDDVIIEVDAESAIAHLATVVAGHRVAALRCPRCSFVHTDRDRFAVTPHRRHQCQRCGRFFWDRERTISNVTAEWAALFGADRTIAPAPAHLDLRLDEFAAVGIWASSPAIVWTGATTELEGLHVHARNHARVLEVDETYGSVTLDGVNIDPGQVRRLMVQQALPLTRRRVADLVCPACGRPHDDVGSAAFAPSNSKTCSHCARVFVTPGRRNVVSNPTVGLVQVLGGRT